MCISTNKKIEYCNRSMTNELNDLKCRQKQKIIMLKRELIISVFYERMLVKILINEVIQLQLRWSDLIVCMIVYILIRMQWLDHELLYLTIWIAFLFLCFGVWRLAFPFLFFVSWERARVFQYFSMGLVYCSRDPQISFFNKTF